jgi:hypothetical protein
MEMTGFLSLIPKPMDHRVPITLAAAVVVAVAPTSVPTQTVAMVDLEL